MKLKKILFIICLLFISFFMISIDIVYAADDKYIKSIDINNNPKSIKINEKDDFKCSVDMKGWRTFEGEIVWGSSDTNVATVKWKSENWATVTGVSDGTVVIKACLKSNPNMCSSVSLVVGAGSAARVREITIDGNDFNISQGAAESVHFHVNMNGATTFQGKFEQQDYAVWTSSNESVAKVFWESEQQAKIDTFSPGTSTIKVCIMNQPDVCSSIVINVIDKTKTTDEHEDRVQSFKVTENPITLETGQNKTLNIKYYEVDSSKLLDEDKITLTWTTSDSSIVSVTKKDKNNAEIVGIANGTATIKVCMANGKCAPDVKVTVSGSINEAVGLDGNQKLADFSIKDTEDAISTCDGLIDDNLKAVLQKVLLWVRIIAPILLILFGTVDFGMVVISQDQDAMKKAVSKLVKRALAAIALFFIPLLVSVLLNMPGISEKTDPTCGI